MKCEASSINKYLDKDLNIFFIYGSEIILKNNSKDLIKRKLLSKGFDEKKIINKNDFNNIEQQIIENAGGSLFGSKIMIEINHDQGRVPDQISKIFQIPNIDKMSNIALIITSHNDKLNSATNWVKAMDKKALIIQCKKLKSFEEKIWLKHQLDFVHEKDKPTLIQNISEMNSGNLVAQQNEVKILKLLYKEGENQAHKSSIDSAEFAPFELEDMIISRNTKDALRMIHSIKNSEAHYAPLLVWIIGKIINSASYARQNQNPKISLEKSGVWKNKISDYMVFIKHHSLKELIQLQKNVFELDIVSKGLVKKDFWNELDDIVIDLTSN